MKKPSKKRAAGIERIVSIPDDVVLAPQAEAPRHPMTADRSGARSAVRELSWAQFDRLVQTLAHQIQRSFAPTVVVGIAHGGVFVGGAVAEKLGCDFQPVRLSRRSRDKGRSGPIGQLPSGLAGKQLLVVDDVCTSGDTLELARSVLSNLKPAGLKTACLVQHTDVYQPDFLALPTDELIVFPWDYEEVSEVSRFNADPDKPA